MALIGIHFTVDVIIERFTHSVESPFAAGPVEFGLCYVTEVLFAIAAVFDSGNGRRSLLVTAF